MVALWWLVACASGPGPDSAGKDTGPDDSAADTADTGDTADTSDTADTDTGEPDPDTLDQDRDGYTPADGDCDDTREHVYPGAPDGCDGLDQDCDGEPIPDHSCSETWDVSTMWSWEIRWAGVNFSSAHTGQVAGGGAPDLVLHAWADDEMIYVWSPPESGLPVTTWLEGDTWTDDSPDWGIFADLAPVDSTGDGLDDVWVITTWRGGGPSGGLFLFTGTDDPIPADDTRLDRAAAAVWLDGDGVRLETDGDPRGGVGDLTGDGLADVLLFTLGSGGSSQISALAGDPELSGEHTFGSLPQMFVDEDAGSLGAEFVGDLDGDGMDEVQFNYVGSDELCLLSGADWAGGSPVADLCSVAFVDSVSDADVLGDHSRNELTGGDLDGDGLVDLQVHGSDTAGVSFMRLLTGGIPTGEISRWTSVMVSGVWAYGWVPDIDGDGVNDPVTTSGAVSSSALREGGTFETTDLHLLKTWSAPGHSLDHVADIDQDGWPDWIMANNRTDENQRIIVRGFDIPWDDPSKW